MNIVDIYRNASYLPERDIIEEEREADDYDMWFTECSKACSSIEKYLDEHELDYIVSEAMRDDELFPICLEILEDYGLDAYDYWEFNEATKWY